MINFVLVLSSFFILTSCSGVFTNPDVKTQKSNKLPLTVDLKLLETSQKEERIINIINMESDLSPADFFWFQKNLLDLAVRKVDPNGYSLNASGFSVNKNMGGPMDKQEISYNHKDYLKKIATTGYPVLELNNPTAFEIATIMELQVPVIGFCKSNYRHDVKGGKVAYVQLDELVLFSGYKRYTKNGTIAPGESKNKIRFISRDRMNILCGIEKEITKLSVNIENNNYGGTRHFKNFYIILPKAFSKASFLEDMDAQTSRFNVQEILEPIEIK